jgi:hypothetical protein
MTIMGPIWGFVMIVKNQRLLWDLICRYCNECKNQQLLWDPYAGIAYLKMALWKL